MSLQWEADGQLCPKALCRKLSRVLDFIKRIPAMCLVQVITLLLLRSLLRSSQGSAASFQD